MMGTYDCRGEYMYIGCVFSSSGLHYAIGDSAREVFNKMLAHRPKSVRIIKISSKYCMPVTKMFGKEYCPDTPENADIDKHLAECSKDQSTFYYECMKYVPCEISSVRPDGVVGCIRLANWRLIIEECPYGQRSILVFSDAEMGQASFLGSS